MKKLLLPIACLFASVSVFAAVDLNTATQSQLEGVKGIGPSKAKAIIDFRTKNGAFRSFDDLDKVPGFGKSTLDRLRGELTVGGAKAAVPAAKGSPPPKSK